MTSAEFFHRRTARIYRGEVFEWVAPRCFLDKQAAHHERCADILALDGVTLSLDEATAPCALTPGALFGEAP